MRKLIAGLLLFMAGWGLGWYAHQLRGTDPVRSAQPAKPALPNAIPPEKTAAVTAPVVPDHADGIAELLSQNAFDAVLVRYEALQVQADDAALAAVRNRILSHARQLLADGSLSLAELLLQRFLLAAHRDVDARVLLAETLLARGDSQAAIDQLYEARGYAYRPDRMQRITGRIRTLVAELAQSLKRNDDQEALLALYQHLTQLEPDHAPWFMGLAESQLALDDPEAARRSLLLVSQDPDVGLQAQTKLAELNLALAELQDTQLQDAAAEVVGIPLNRSGNHFIVDAIPADGRSIRLLIDTGASLTILTPEVLEQHRIRYRDTGRSGVFNTANGVVRAPVYKLDYLSVGGWQVHHLEIGVLDLGSRSDVDGLLGMNFLSHFQFFIDQNESLLRLSAN